MKHHLERHDAPTVCREKTRLKSCGEEWRIVSCFYFVGILYLVFFHSDITTLNALGSQSMFTHPPSTIQTSRHCSRDNVQFFSQSRKSTALVPSQKEGQRNILSSVPESATCSIADSSHGLSSFLSLSFGIQINHSTI